jgi:hypothetical protein
VILFSVALFIKLNLAGCFHAFVGEVMRTNKIIIIYLLLCQMLSFSRAYTQDARPIVLACVMPTDPDAGSPYVLAFRNSTLFGLIIPIAANITLFSNRPLTTALRQITTDAPTGGYRLGFEVARLRSAPKLLNSGDCNEDINQLSEALKISVDQNTLPIPVSAQYGLTMQLDGDDKVSNSYLGVFGFQIQATNDARVTNFQVGQISSSAPNIEISLSNVTQATPASFMVIGNKGFGIRKSGAANPDSFSSEVKAEDFTYLEDQIQDQMPALFALMQASNLSIFPNHILGYTTPQPFTGGYLSLELNTTQAQRQPEFTPDSKVVILTDGIEAKLFLPSRPGDAFGKLVGGNSLVVVRVDEQGQLIVRSQDGQEAIIEAWRVKVSDPAP